MPEILTPSPTQGRIVAAAETTCGACKAKLRVFKDELFDTRWFDSDGDRHGGIVYLCPSCNTEQPLVYSGQGSVPRREKHADVAAAQILARRIAHLTGNRAAALEQLRDVIDQHFPAAPQ